MISELSPGDKLSLKGKIFELRKRLNEVEVEKQRAEQYSFRPQVSQYEYLERGSDFLQSIERAELMRKQKMQLLKATLAEEDNSRCTFKPAITSYRSSNGHQQSGNGRNAAIVSSSSASSSSHKPVHERLTEAGKVYQSRHAERAERMKHYDNDGRRLFQPSIPRHPADDEGTVNSSRNSISADEYLYRDARNREIRMQQRIIEANNEINTEFKVNATSEQLLRKKAEREIRLIFQLFDENNENTITFATFRSTLDGLVQSGRLQRKQMLQWADRVWPVLAKEKDTRTELGAFMKICMSACYPRLHQSQQQQSQQGRVVTSGNSGNVMVAERFNPNSSSNSNINGRGSSRDGAASKAMQQQPLVTAEDTALIKDFVSGMVGVCRCLEQEQSATNNNSDHSFRPELTEKTKKLAQRKMSKEQSDNQSNRRLSAFENLLQRGEERKKRQESLRQSLLKQEMEECTFKPNRITASYYDSAEQEQEREQQHKAIYKNGSNQYNNNDPANNDVTVSIIEYDCDDDYEGDQGFEYDDDQRHAHDSFERVEPCNNSPSNNTIRSKTRTSEELAFERLYKLKDKPVNTHQHQPTSITELSQCTFKPQVDHSTLNLPSSAPTALETKSVEKTVARMIKAREMRKQEAEKLESMGQVDESKYAKSRELMAQGPVPFSFQLDERKKFKEQQKQVKKKPKLYIDVKLGPHRTVNIAVTDGDNPHTIAEQFCRIYALDMSACAVLAQVVRENMEANGIPIDGQFGREHSSPSVASQLENEQDRYDEDIHNMGNSVGDNIGAAPASTSHHESGDFDKDSSNNDGAQLVKPLRRKTVFRKAVDENYDFDAGDSVRSSQDDYLDSPMASDSLMNT